MNPRLLIPLRERASHTLPRFPCLSPLSRSHQSHVAIYQPKAQFACCLENLLPRCRQSINISVCKHLRALKSGLVPSDWKSGMAAEAVSGGSSSVHEVTCEVAECESLEASEDCAKGVSKVISMDGDRSHQPGMSVSSSDFEIQLSAGRDVRDEGDLTRISAESGVLTSLPPASATLNNISDPSSLGTAEARNGLSYDVYGSGDSLCEGEGNDTVAKRLRVGGVESDDVSNEKKRRITAAWDHWRKLGEPKMHVAPMVDQSELPFRMLCRKYGATAAYTPMLHSRLFAKDVKYRKEFTTCPEDRPLFVQFCANNPETLLEAAKLVESCCDYVDINLGCPQRIAKKGNYGAFLMDNLPLVKSLVSKLATNLTVPVSCKIRVFPNLEDTLAYARMLEDAGCSLLAVHGRTRDQKDGRVIRADWEAIKAVKKALRIPVLANGNIRWLEDVHACMASTGADGVMSADSLLENPALYAGYRMAHSFEKSSVENLSSVAHATGQEGSDEQLVQNLVDERTILLEYLHLCEKYPVPMRMVRGHVHKILGGFWFKKHPDIREELNKQHILTIPWLKDMVLRLMAFSVSNGSLPISSQESQFVLSSPSQSRHYQLSLSTAIASQDLIS